MEDLETFHAAILRNREYLLPWIGPWIKAEPLTLDARRPIVQGWVDSYADGADNPVGIFIGDQLVGGTGLHDRNQPADVEVGYWVDEAHQGKGIATRVTRALLALAFREPSVERVLLIHNVNNVKSRRVPEKLGFVEIPTSTQCGDDTGIMWEMTRTAWESRN